MEKVGDRFHRANSWKRRVASCFSIAYRADVGMVQADRSRFLRYPAQIGGASPDHMASLFLGQKLKRRAPNLRSSACRPSHIPTSRLSSLKHAGKVMGGDLLANYTAQPQGQTHFVPAASTRGSYCGCFATTPERDGSDPLLPRQHVSDVLRVVVQQQSPQTHFAGEPPMVHSNAVGRIHNRVWARASLVSLAG